MTRFAPPQREVRIVVYQDRILITWFCHLRRQFVTQTDNPSKLEFLKWFWSNRRPWKVIVKYA